MTNAIKESPTKTATAAPGFNQSAASGTVSHRRWWLVALEWVALLLAAITILELGLRAAGIGQQEFLAPDLKLGCRHLPNKLVVWRMEGFSSDHLSSTGLRDSEHSIAKPEGVTRIALLGDSATEGLQVPLSQTYGRKLEAMLNARQPRKFEVINFAVSSFSNAQEYLQFKNEVAAYKPDVTVVLTNGGDANMNVRFMPPAKAEPKPFFYLDGQGNLQLDDSALQAQKNKLQANAVMDFLRRNSCIYGVLSQTNLALSINEPFYRKLHRAFDNLIWPPNKNFAAVQYSVQNPWLVTTKIFSALNDECGKAHSHLVILVFPNTLRNLDLGLQSSELADQGKKEGFAVVDLTPAFLTAPDTNSLFCQVHFSAKGHQLVAEQLAKCLKDNALIR